ncbi:MAG: PD40 domain-containing protein [Candidatus Aminicenantes bacterium]|nr:PD40 domain-containing protein [Candidatus Aminicenantes bacterium]
MKLHGNIWKFVAVNVFIALFLWIISTPSVCQDSPSKASLPVLIPMQGIPDIVKYSSIPGQGRVEEVVFSPDGKYLVLSVPAAIILRDLKSGEEKILRIKTHFSSCPQISFSHDGKTLASVFGDEVVIWDMSSFKSKIIKETPYTTVVDLSPDGRTIVTGFLELSLLDVTTGKKVKTLMKEDKNSNYRHFCFRFSPDGKFIFSARNNEIVMLDTITGKILKTLSGHKNNISDMALSSDGKLLASGEYDNGIILWDTITGNKLKEISLSKILKASYEKLDQEIGGMKVQLKYGIFSICFSPENKIVAAAVAPFTFSWDEKVRSNTSVVTIDLINDNIRVIKLPFCCALTFSPDGRFLVTASADGNVLANFWDMSGYNIKRNFIKDPFETTQEYEARVKTLEFPYSFPVYLDKSQYDADKGGFETKFFINELFIPVEREKAKEMVNKSPDSLKLTGKIKYYKPETLMLDQAELVDMTSGEKYPVVNTGLVEKKEAQK